MDSAVMHIKGHDLKLTHLDKVFWPHEGYTKEDLLAYYQHMAPFILPYLKNRPVVLHRYPNGIEKEGFYQKDVATDSIPSWIRTVDIKHQERIVKYFLIQDEASLLYVINLGCIDLHPFHSRISNSEHPDYLILDLDPHEISFDHVIQTAQVIHEILEEAGVEGLCKTSGGRGLHIYVPLEKHVDYHQAKKIAEYIALDTHKRLPKFTTVEHAMDKKQKKVYIDVLRNNWAQTVVAPYSIRPYPHAPVSTPLKWQEVKPGLDPLEFTLRTVPKRVTKLGDLFACIERKPKMKSCHGSPC